MYMKKLWHQETSILLVRNRRPHVSTLIISSQRRLIYRKGGKHGITVTRTINLNNFTSFFYIQLQSESDSYKVEIFCKLIINYIKRSGRNHIHPNFHMGIQKQAYRIDFTLGFQWRCLRQLVGRGVKLSPNISLNAISGSTEPTSFATTQALSATWSMSFVSVQSRCTNCNLLCFVFNPIPHLR